MRVLPVPNVNIEPGSLKVIRNSRKEGVLPQISASRGTTMPVCGGVEAYNKRSLHVKYRAILLGVHPFCSGPPWRYKFTEDSWNMRAKYP